MEEKMVDGFWYRRFIYDDGGSGSSAGVGGRACNFYSQRAGGGFET